MTVSSRTPEGRPNRCPICGKTLVIEPSGIVGDAPCPHCGSLLFFLALGKSAVYFPHDSPAREQVEEILAEQLGVSKAQVEELRATAAADKAPSGIYGMATDELGADSLDMVELFMTLEEEFDLPDRDDDPGWTSPG